MTNHQPDRPRGPPASCLLIVSILGNLARSAEESPASEVRVRSRPEPRPRPVLPPGQPKTRFPERPDWPDPQSQSLFRSYGSRLPISLTHIHLSTRGSQPRRPDAEMGTVCGETGSPKRSGGRDGGPPRTGRARPDDDPCDYLTCIFHGLALVHGTTQELCRSTATAWSLYHHPHLASYDFQGSRGLKQKRKLSPGPDASGHKPDPVTRARHTYDLALSPGGEQARPVRPQVTE